MTDPGATPQPVRALQLANRVRHARAELKARVADGQLAVADVIMTCPVEVAGMPVVQLLASQHGWGDARCGAFLAQVGVRENKPIGSLTERQRRAVAVQLTDTSARAQLDRAAPRQTAARRATSRSGR
ncbi:MAG: hypothetical protein WBP81_02270 [Solirubrobacteraceae bacterium]